MKREEEALHKEIEEDAWSKEETVFFFLIATSWEKTMFTIFCLMFFTFKTHVLIFEKKIKKKVLRNSLARCRSHAMRLFFVLFT